MRRGLSGSLLLAAALLAAVPAGASLGPDDTTSGGIAPRVSAGRLWLETAEPAPLSEILRAIGAAAGIEVVVRREPGPVGPVRLEAVPLAEALRLLAGRHSLVLGYREEAGVPRVARVILVAGEPSDEAAAPTPIVRREATLPLPLPDPAATARNERAATIRDIVKLSYRHDDAAVAELQRILAASDDPAVRGAAVSALAGVGGPTAERLIARGLVDRDPKVRLRAAQSLWLAQGADARVRLLATAQVETDPEVRVGIERLLREGPPRDRGSSEGPHPQRADR